MQRSVADEIGDLFDELKDDEDLRTIGLKDFLDESRAAVQALETARDSITAWPHSGKGKESFQIRKKAEVEKVVTSFELLFDQLMDYKAALLQTKKDDKRKENNSNKRVKWAYRNIVDAYVEGGAPAALAEAFATIEPL